MKRKYVNKICGKEKGECICMGNWSVRDGSPIKKQVHAVLKILKDGLRRDKKIDLVGIEESSKAWSKCYVSH